MSNRRSHTSSRDEDDTGERIVELSGVLTILAQQRDAWYSLAMKKDIHPDTYRPVVFEDLSSGAAFLIGSTIATTETTKFEGKEYPKFVVEISSKSHPFYTGEDRTLDKAGRVERFKQRAAKKK